VAADVLADLTLRDAVLKVNLALVDAEVRASWIKAVSRMDDELAAAESLSLDAIAARPGWPFHESLLGQLAFQRASRSPDASLGTHSERWRVPLLDAATVAGSDITLWQSLALGYLQTWPTLKDEDRLASPSVFRRAFAGPEFVRALFLPAIQLLGVRQAVSFLPESSKPLWEAFVQILRSGEIEAAWLVHRRWDDAEWRERADDLEQIEIRQVRGDIDEVRALCESWTARHALTSYDSPAAHRQGARLLELWPGGRQGPWERDGRADLIRYLLDRRHEYVSGPSLERAVDGLEGVPAATRAQILLMAGNLDAARSVAKGSEDLGSLAWTPYLLAAAREARKRGDSAEATRLLTLLSPAAQGECDTSQAQEDIKLVPPRRSGLEVVTPLPSMSAGAGQSLCVPASGGRFAVRLTADNEEIVDWTVNGARRGSCLLAADRPALFSDWLRGGYALISTRILP
jgi:hypothetical protein